MSEDAKDLVRRLLEFNPDNRINALDALNHTWVQNNANIDRVTAEVATRTLRNLQQFRVSNFVGDRIFARLVALLSK